MSDFRQITMREGGNIGVVPELDWDHCYRAVASRDARFDGWFVTAVRTTSIYCRPSCPAVTPKRRNVTFYRTSAAAQSAGFRACRRCLPDAVPGSPEWNLRADLAARAMRLINDGVVERDGVPGLASKLGYSERHLNRVLTEELGAGPLALARAHRAHAARLLVETTALPMADVAFAAGFASVRQFNETLRGVFGVTPSALRTDAARRPEHDHPAPGAIALRLPFRPPLDSEGLRSFLAARSVAGVEHATDRSYARTLALPHGAATARLVFQDSAVHAVLRLTDLRDLGTAVSRLRRLIDADADPVGCDEVLARDPALRASVAATPGIRLPGAVDGAEIVLRAVLGQQVTVAAARTAASRLAAALGTPLPAVFDSRPDSRPDFGLDFGLDSESDSGGALTRLFPTPAMIAEHGAEVLTGPRKRIDTIVRACAALASGELAVHAGRDFAELRADLESLPGIGAWTSGYIAMRVLGAPDVLLTTDLAVRRGAAALGLPSESSSESSSKSSSKSSTADDLAAHGKRWAPWRSYAGLHLWRAAGASSSTRPSVRRSA